MTLKLMYITNRPDIARIAEASGVDIVFVDLEILGKQARQGHLDTVISKHTIDDVRAVRTAVTQADLLVRVNPIHDGSPAEIEQVIEAGADIVMLPYFTSHEEVATFVRQVAGRAKVCLLLETPAAVDEIDAILEVGGIDLVHIGLNDLHLGYGQHFMFEPLVDGTVELLCAHLARAGIPYGFGGIAQIGQGDLPAEAIIAEHHRLGSTMVILSRTFCDVRIDSDPARITKLFSTELTRIRTFEDLLAAEDNDFFEDNRRSVAESVKKISERNAARRSGSPATISSGDANGRR